MTANAIPLTPHDSRDPNSTASGAGLTPLDPGACAAGIPSCRKAHP
jgi:hypothetical protein